MSRNENKYGNEFARLSPLLVSSYWHLTPQINVDATCLMYSTKLTLT